MNEFNRVMQLRHSLRTHEFVAVVVAYSLSLLLLAALVLVVALIAIAVIAALAIVVMVTTTTVSLAGPVCRHTGIAANTLICGKLSSLRYAVRNRPQVYARVA